jgi:hypothetical protein
MRRLDWLTMGVQGLTRFATGLDHIIVINYEWVEGAVSFAIGLTLPLH